MLGGDWTPSQAAIFSGVVAWKEPDEAVLAGGSKPGFRLQRTKKRGRLSPLLRRVMIHGDDSTASPVGDEERART